LLLRLKSLKAFFEFEARVFNQKMSFDDDDARPHWLSDWVQADFCFERELSS
jgi:hypothetical protein